MTTEFTKVLERVQELAGPYLESLGLSLWGIETFGGEGRPVLRLFIDAEDGVDVEDCAQVSRQLGTAMDVEDLIHGAYSLEVSSPGLERRFFDPAQLPPYVGRELDVTTQAPIEGRKRFKGMFTALEDGVLTMACEGVTAAIPWSNVARARLVHTFETPEELKAKAKAPGKKTFKADKAATPDPA